MLKLTSKNIITSILITTACLGASGVAKATVVDLTQTNSGSINGALYSISYVQPAGTGIYDPFLTIQANTTEQGYNSATEPFDTKRAPQWNHEIRLSDLQVTTIGGVQYFGFGIDVNEPNAGTLGLISLDAVKIYTSSTLQSGTSTNSSGTFNGSLGTLVYSLDAGGDNWVKYDDQHPGSGTDDIAMFIPVSLFANASSTDYVYMYQQWGNNFNTSLETQGGFEETRIIAGSTFSQIPEVSAFLPLGVVLATGLGFRQYRPRRELA